jgi:hypothetical protein
MSDNVSPPQQKPEEGDQSKHIDMKITDNNNGVLFKVADNNNEVFFKVKRTTQLGKLMNAFCDRQVKEISSVRFLFDGTRVQPQDSSDTVRLDPAAPRPCFLTARLEMPHLSHALTQLQLDLQDGDTLEVH